MVSMAPFRDRIDAGRQLADALRGHVGDSPVVLGIPRGGVVVAAEIARELGGELGVVVARKMGAPMHPELAIGATTAAGGTYIEEDVVRMLSIGQRYISEEAERQAHEARRREEAFDGHLRPSPRGREVIVVDDGIATGATAIAALRSLRSEGASRVLLAVPVAPPEAIERMRGEADEIISLIVEPDFGAVGRFYIDFRPTSDEQVIDLLEASHRPHHN
jgi:predicted phosphoribosyltransferase